MLNMLACLNKKSTTKRLTDKILDGLRARVEYISRVDPNLAVFDEGHLSELAPFAAAAR